VKKKVIYSIKEQRVADRFPQLWKTALKLAEGDIRRIHVLSIAKVEVYPKSYKHYIGRRKG